MSMKIAGNSYSVVMGEKANGELITENLKLIKVEKNDGIDVEIYQYGKGTVVTYDTSKDPHAPIDWILIEKLDNLYS